MFWTQHILFRTILPSYFLLLSIISKRSIASLSTVFVSLRMEACLSQPAQTAKWVANQLDIWAQLILYQTHSRCIWKLWTCNAERQIVGVISRYLFVMEVLVRKLLRWVERKPTMEESMLWVLFLFFPQCHVSKYPYCVVYCRWASSVKTITSTFCYGLDVCGAQKQSP